MARKEDWADGGGKMKSGDDGELEIGRNEERERTERERMKMGKK